MNRREERDEERRREAQSALGRVESDSETVGSSSFARVARQTRDHFAAHDKQGESDRIEVWGSRIGRAAGLIFTVALVIYLALAYL
ncbi:hypothetical protein C8N35_108113 [Breoghania corrubedonensis]|uniref:Uncharacterized protein n=1 Tax=Breoghania corrubedonensis TaxID=665038 RepID=A0A2T5V5N6_9HYPH|nr:hypothetical protein [Breoghania corrubedonensis]PTW59077.1 hypothetical protein C8N35_108113 [Breoghania corrubedonensis]